MMLVNFSSVTSRTLLFLLGLAAVLYAAIGVTSARAQSADLALVSDDNTKVTFVRNFTTGAFINDANDTVNAGDEVQFLIKVHNQGPDAVAATPSSPIIVQAPHPANFILKTASNNADPGVVYDAANQEFRIERTVAFDEVVQFQYRFYASAVSTGTNFTAQISSTPVPDSRADNDAFSRSVNITGPSADLTFDSPNSGSKTFLRNLTAPGQPFLADGASVNLGEELSLFIKIHNLGPEVAAASSTTPIIIAPTIPAGFTILQGLTFNQPNFFYDAATNRFRIERNVAVDEVVQVEVRIRATSVASNTTVVAEFAALPVSDPDTSDASNKFQKTINIVAQVGDVGIDSVTPDATTLPAGQDVLFTLIATNHGGPQLTNAFIDLVIPAGLTFVQAEPGGNGAIITVPGTGENRWQIGTWPTGAQRTIVGRFATDPNAPGEQTLTVTYNGLNDEGQADPNSTNDSASGMVTVLAVADLNVSITGDKSEVTVDDSLMLTFTANNLSATETATDVVYDVTIPPTFSNPVQGLGDGTFSNGQWSVPSIAAGSQAFLQVFVTADSTPAADQVFDITHTASTPLDPDSSNDFDSLTISIVERSADLRVSLSVISPPPPHPISASVDQEFTVFISASVVSSNTSPEVVRISLPLPAGFILPFNQENMPIYDSATGIWTLFNQARSPGGFYSGSQTVILKPTQAGTFDLTATIVDATYNGGEVLPDPDPSNNSETITGLNITPSAPVADMQINAAAGSLPPGVEPTSLIRALNGTQVLNGQDVFVGEYLILRRTISSAGPDDPLVGQDNGSADVSLTTRLLLDEQFLFPARPSGFFSSPPFGLLENDGDFFTTGDFTGGAASATATIKALEVLTSETISAWVIGNALGLYGQAVDPDVSAASNRFSVTLNAQRSLSDLAVSWDNPSVTLGQGDWIESVLTVTNLGTQPMFGVFLDLTLDPNVLLQDLQVSTGEISGTELVGFSLGDLPNSTRWSINALDVGQSATLTLSVFGRADSGAASFNVVASSADSDESDPSNNNALLDFTFGPAGVSALPLFDRFPGEIPPADFTWVKAIPDNLDGGGNPSPFFAPESIVFLSPLDPQLQLVSDEISDVAIAYNSVRNEFLQILEIRFKAKDSATSTADSPDVYEIYAVRIDAFTGQPLDRDADGFADLTRLTWVLDDSLNVSARHPAIAYNSQDDTYLVAWTEIAATEGDTLDPMVPKTARYRILAGDATYDLSDRSGTAFQIATGANPQGLDTNAYSSAFRPAVAYLSTFNDFAFAVAGRPTVGDPIGFPVDEVFAGRLGVNGGVASLVSDHQYGLVLAGGAGAVDQRVGRVSIIPGADDGALGLAWDIGEPIPGLLDYDGSATLHSRVFFSTVNSATLLPQGVGAGGRGHLAMIDEEPNQFSTLQARRPKEGSFPNTFTVPLGFVSTRTAFEPDLAYDNVGDQYLLVWAGRRASKNLAPDNGQTEVYGRLLSASGTFTTPIRRISRPYEGDIAYIDAGFGSTATPLHNAENPHAVFYPGAGTFLVSYDVCGHFIKQSTPGGRHCTPGINLDQIDAATGFQTDINKDGLFDRGYNLLVLGGFPIPKGQNSLDAFDRGNDIAVVSDGLIGLAMRRPLATNKSYGEWHQAGFRRLNVTTDVAVQLGTSNFQPEPGEIFDLTVTLTNTSDNAAANNIIIDVPLPGDQAGAALIFQSGAGAAGWSYDVASGQLQLDHLAADSSETYTMTVRNSFADQEVAVSAELFRLAEFDSITINNTSSINLLVPAGADLALEMGNQQIFLTETEIVTLTLRANSGSIANAVVSFVPPGPGFSFVPGESVPSVGSFDEPTLTWTLPPTVSSEEATLAFKIEGLEAGDHDLSASVVGELSDPFPANSSVTAVMAVLATHPITVDTGALFGLFGQPVPSNGLARSQITAQDALSRPISYNWVVDCPDLTDELVPFDGSFEFSDPTSPQWDWRAPFNLSGTDQICSVRVEMSVEGNARSLWWPDEQNGQAFTVLEHPEPFTNYRVTADAESLVEAGSTRVLGGVGEQAQYVFNIINLSEMPGSNVQIDVLLPDGVDYATHTLIGNGDFTPGATSGEAGVWQLTSLNPSAVATLTVTVDINTDNFGNPDPEGSDLQSAVATLISSTPADPDGAPSAIATLERYLVNRVSILQEPALFIDWDTVPVAVQALVSQGQGRFLGLEASNSLGRPMSFLWTQACSDGTSLGNYDDASGVEPIWTAPVFIPDEPLDLLSCTLDVTVSAGVTANDITMSHGIRIAAQSDVDLALSFDVLDKAVLLGGRVRLQLTITNNGPEAIDLENIGAVIARMSLPDELQLDLASVVPAEALFHKKTPGLQLVYWQMANPLP